MIAKSLLKSKSWKRALWRCFGPKSPRVKHALWKLLRLHRIPPRPGLAFEIRERLGRTEYHKPATLQYFSQGGQDRFLNEVVFCGKMNGVFAEVGANDSLRLSNTYFFEKQLGWSGLCGEPNPFAFSALTRNRRARCIQACAGASSGEVDFPVVPDPDLSLYARQGTWGRQPGTSTVRVPRRTLTQLFDEAGFSSVDYLSIDTEGEELATFRALEHQRFRVAVVSLEQNENPLVMDRQMMDLGYVLVATGRDRIYQRRRKA